MDQWIREGKHKIPEYYWLNQETSNLADDEKRFHSLIGQLKKLKEWRKKKVFGIYA